MDLAIGNYMDNTVSILPGNGDGTFQSEIKYKTDKIPICLVSGDLNNDKKLDLIVINNESNDLSVFLNICKN